MSFNDKLTEVLQDYQKPSSQWKDDRRFIIAHVRDRDTDDWEIIPFASLDDAYIYVTQRHSGIDSSRNQFARNQDEDKKWRMWMAGYLSSYEGKEGVKINWDSRSMGMNPADYAPAKELKPSEPTSGKLSSDDEWAREMPQYGYTLVRTIDTPINGKINRGWSVG